MIRRQLKRNGERPLVRNFTLVIKQKIFSKNDNHLNFTDRNGKGKLAKHRRTTH